MSVSSSNLPRVLIVEDDEEIAGAISIIVQRHGYMPVVSSHGKEGLQTFFKDNIDLVILDVGLPHMDGWQVLERLRELSNVPIMMLTAHDREADKVRGLSAGADDYVTKPFGVRELGARIDALIRRSRLTPVETDNADDSYSDGELVVNWAAREVLVDGHEVNLTALEFQLLQTFIDHEGQALSAAQLLRLVWDDPYSDAPDRVKFTLLRLRRKLGWSSTENSRIEAVRGYGYRYRRAK
jgi:DNA-binding response OmpR family regulator